MRDDGGPTRISCLEFQREDALRSEAVGMYWPDKELIDLLKTGGYDYFQRTPPISWFVRIASPYICQ